MVHFGLAGNGTLWFGREWYTLVDFGREWYTLVRYGTFGTHNTYTHLCFIQLSSILLRCVDLPNLAQDRAIH